MLSSACAPALKCNMYFLECQTPPRIKKSSLPGWQYIRSLVFQGTASWSNPHYPHCKGFFSHQKMNLPKNSHLKGLAFWHAHLFFGYPFVQVLLKWYGPHGKSQVAEKHAVWWIATFFWRVTSLKTIMTLENPHFQEGIHLPSRWIFLPVMLVFWGGSPTSQWLITWLRLVIRNPYERGSD